MDRDSGLKRAGRAVADAGKTAALTLNDNVSRFPGYVYRRFLKPIGHIDKDRREQWDNRQASLIRRNPIVLERLIDGGKKLRVPTSNQLSDMELFLVRHTGIKFNVLGKRRTPQLEIDLRAARRDVERLVRFNELSAVQAFWLRRSYRITVWRLEREGAKRDRINGTLTLGFNSSKRWWRTKVTRPEADAQQTVDYQVTQKTVAILNEARRQREPITGPLLYDPSLAERTGLDEELERLDKAGLATKNNMGVWKLEEFTLYRLIGEQGRTEEPLSAETLRILHQHYAEVPKSDNRKWVAVSADTEEKRAALIELENQYSQAVRQTANGFERHRSNYPQALRWIEQAHLKHDFHKHGQPSYCIKTDHRLAHALAFGGKTPDGKKTLYVPADDATGRGAQTERCLSQLLAEDGQDLVQRAQGGAYYLDREKALAALHAHRQAKAHYLTQAGLNKTEIDPGLLETFKRYGTVECGQWIIDPQAVLLHVVEKQPKSKPDVMLWHLHQAVIHSLSRDDKTPLVSQRADGCYVLSKKSAREAGLEGTLRWAHRMAKDKQGLGERVQAFSMDAEAFLSRSVAIKGNLEERIEPLEAEVAKNTRTLYLGIAKRYRNTALEAQPLLLAKRANQLAKTSWNNERAVLRRMLLSSELAASRGGDNATRFDCYLLRTGVEKMSYVDIRQAPLQKKANPAKAPINPAALRELKTKLKKDPELSDALTVFQYTGCRPEELHKGVKLEPRSENHVQVTIQGAKCSAGMTGAARYEAKRGIPERHFEVVSAELFELATRLSTLNPDAKEIKFKPESSQAALRKRLNRARSDVKGADTLSFYSFRNAFKDNLEKQGFSSLEIANRLGHSSTRSQEHYYVK